MNESSTDTGLRKCPDLPESGRSMSNFDHSIDDGMEQDLRNGMRGSHEAWNFYANVWFEDGRFFSQVNRYGGHVDTIAADSLEDLMEKTNEQYGYE